MMRYLTTPLAALFAIAVLGACGNGDTTNSAATAQPAAAVEPVDAKIESRPLDGDSVGKPGLPVRIGYEFLGTPAVNEPLTVRLNIEGRDVSGLSMSMSTRGQIALSKNAPTRVALKSAVTDASAEQYDTVVNISGAGRSYLNVQITGIYDNQPFTKAVSIPVQVGAGGPVLNTNGEIIDDGVEILSSMPAEQQVDNPPAKD